jgi:hypothetical protein
MGSATEQLDVIYDTGSDYLAVDTDLCSDCTTLDATYFNTASSSSFDKVDTEVYQYYDDVTYKGYVATDTVAVDSGATTAVSTFSFFAISDTEWEEEHDRNAYYDGFLGFCRQYTDTDGTSLNGPLWLEAATTASVITAEIIAFSLTGEDETSFVDIGAYDTAGILDGDSANIVWVNMPDESFFWYSNEVQAVQIGEEDTTEKGKTAAYNYENWVYPAIYDTGTSFIYAPAGLGLELMLRLARGSTYLFDEDSGLMIIDCDEFSDYEDFYLTIDGYKFTVLADDYLYEVEAENYWEDNSCFLGIIQDNTIN